MKNRTPVGFPVIIICITILLSSAGLVYSLDLGKGTRETDLLSGERKEEQVLERPPEKPEELISKEERPAPPEERKILVRKVVLVGCESFSPELFAPLTAKYENKESALSELETLCKSIEREYLRRSVIAAVFVPPQEIKEGEVSLRVVEARMGELLVQKHKYFKNKILQRYWKVRANEIIYYDKMLKSVQLMNKNPDREVKASLVAGKKPGTTDILLSPTTKFPIHPMASYDNEGSRPTGTDKIGFAIRHNNFLNEDDTALTGYMFGKHFSSVYAFHSLPISSEGATLVYGFSSSRSKPKGDYVPYDMRSSADVITVSVHQDLFNKGDYEGEVFAGFEGKDKWTYANTAGTINRDRLRVVNIGGNFIKRGFGSQAVISPAFYQGLGFLGASPKNNPLASHHAEAVFSRFNLAVSTMTILPFKLRQNFKISGQYASERLDPSEEFNLGGIDSVRGYPAGESLVERAVLTNLEILIPSFFIPQEWKLPYAKKPLKEGITPVVFFDYGLGARRDESKFHSLAGIGGGVRLNLYDKAKVRMEWGFPLGDDPSTQSRATHFHLSVEIAV